MLFVSPAKQSGTQGSCNLVSNIFFKNVGNFKAPSKIKHGIEYLKKVYPWQKYTFDPI